MGHGRDVDDLVVIQDVQVGQLGQRPGGRLAATGLEVPDCPPKHLLLHGGEGPVVCEPARLSRPPPPRLSG